MQSADYEIYSNYDYMRGNQFLKAALCGAVNCIVN